LPEPFRYRFRPVQRIKLADLYPGNIQPRPDRNPGQFVDPVADQLAMVGECCNTGFRGIGDRKSRCLFGADLDG
jgi:hypothetical protein